MNYHIIASGSKGNALVLGENLLVDCGVAYRALEPYLERLRLVLLTHAHRDHFNARTLARLALERPCLRFGCGGWLAHPLLDCGVGPRQIDLLEAPKRYQYPGLTVEPVPLRHDVPNQGYQIISEAGSAFYATDTASLDGVHAPGLDLYLVEANYQEDEIRERMAQKRMAGQFAYERRAMANHLSREQCDRFLAENMGPNSRYVYMHMHEEKETQC